MNRLTHLYLLLVFWHQQFLVGHGPFGSDPTGCWPAIFSCFPCHWLKTSRSSPCGCVLFSSASIPICLKSPTRKIILIIVNNHQKDFDRPVDKFNLFGTIKQNRQEAFSWQAKCKERFHLLGQAIKKTTRPQFSWMERRPQLTSANKSVPVKNGPTFQKGLVIQIQSVETVGVGKKKNEWRRKVKSLSPFIIYHII